MKIKNVPNVLDVVRVNIHALRRVYFVLRKKKLVVGVFLVIIHVYAMMKEIVIVENVLNAEGILHVLNVEQTLIPVPMVNVNVEILLPAPYKLTLVLVANVNAGMAPPVLVTKVV
jgi:hypothetical protein